MRLIDADLLVENCKCTGKFEDNFKCVSLSDLRRVIGKQQTAYDVDKVVEQLEKLKDTEQDDSVAEKISTRNWNKAIQNAISIVKKVELNEQDWKQGIHRLSRMSKMQTTARIKKWCKMGNLLWTW